MTVLRCTAKLLKRLKLPAKPPVPEAQANPLGEWYADIDFWNRKPYVVMLNAATGATLMLNGNAAGLRVLHERAAVQFASLCEYYGIDSDKVDAEAAALQAGFVFGATADRSLLASINQRKLLAWQRFELDGCSLAEAASLEWQGFFKHPKLPRTTRYMDWHCPLELLQQHLLPPAQIIVFPRGRAAQPADSG